MSSLTLWGSFIAFILFLLVMDLGFLNRNPHKVGIKEALLSSAGYIALAMLFNLGVYHFMGAEAGIEFLTGYLIEKSLSIDNIFVFSLIFTQFAIPLKFQHRILFWGILGAIVMRAILILLGAQLLASFHWMLYVFGGFLVFTGIKMLIMIDEPADFSNNKLIFWLKKVFPVSKATDSPSFFRREGGKIMITPMLMVLVLIELSDLVFALDSIPAIFAVTKDPFIVYTTNIFAILGLRSLYFVLADVVTRFHYLKHGLSIILIGIGLKMGLNTYFDESLIESEYTLVFIALVIGGSVLLSFYKTRPRPR
ncbi:MAG: TerC family protein [Candidatus Nucleicultricaceae bacterium]